MKKIFITTGDKEGIGLEIAIKALNHLGPQKNTQFILWRANQEIRNLKITKKFKRFIINDISHIHSIEHKETHLLEIASSLCPTEWVILSTKLCLSSKKNYALVTGPLSKKQMQKDGFSERGHTELLKKLSGKKNIFMTFLGDFFNVVLLTGHTPLKKVSWNKNLLNKCIELCLKFQQTYIKQNDKKLALLGFNPHAGEQGLLGKEELNLHTLTKKWKKHLIGPLVPDTAFLKKNWEKYSFYICLYHDQGLIPFKMIHERKSFQLNLGLPFIRTSVSHGTAFDIFKQNKADPTSMEQALLGAIKFLQNLSNHKTSP